MNCDNSGACQGGDRRVESGSFVFIIPGLECLLLHLARSLVRVPWSIRGAKSKNLEENLPPTFVEAVIQKAINDQSSQWSMAWRGERECRYNSIGRVI